MFVVWANGVEQSIPIEDLEEARDFARESGMDFEIKDDKGNIVYRAAEYEYGIYYTGL